MTLPSKTIFSFVYVFYFENLITMLIPINHSLPRTFQVNVTVMYRNIIEKITNNSKNILIIYLQLIFNRIKVWKIFSKDL